MPNNYCVWKYSEPDDHIRYVKSHTATTHTMGTWDQKELMSQSTAESLVEAYGADWRSGNPTDPPPKPF